MLDPQLVRNQPDLIKDIIKQRNVSSSYANVDLWLQLDGERSEVIKELEKINRERNELAEQSKRGINLEANRELGKKLKLQAAELDEKAKMIEARWLEALNALPNVLMTDVPVGADDSANVTLREVGTKPDFKFAHKDHLELANNLDIIDFEAGAKVAGSQFYYLKNDAVRLELGLLQYGINYLEEQGYKLVMTPDMAKSRYYLGTGYQPRGDEAQIYEIEGEDLGLIATAEVTMAGMYADHVFDEKDLPLKFAAISHCYRREGGAYGKYSKGLYRVHQFTKLEMFVYCLPEQSEQMHQEILMHEEKLLQGLEIPYRVLMMCTGDLGAMAAKKYDLEAWMPGRNDYGEVTSTSNTLDYQARNLNIKYRNSKTGKTDYVHMLNGTAIVTSRFPVAIIENFQQEDGSILVPSALQPYLGKKVITKQ